MKAQSKSLSTDASPRSLWLMGRSSDTKTGICSTSPDLYFSSLALGTNQHLAVLEKRSLQFPCMLLKLHLVQKHTRALFLVRDRGFERCSVLLNRNCSNAGNPKQLLEQLFRRKLHWRRRELISDPPRAHLRLTSQGRGSLWLYSILAFIPNPSWQWPFASHPCSQESQGLMLNCVENCSSLGPVTF